MKYFRYWVLTRSLIVLAAFALAYAIAVHGAYRAVGVAVAAAVGASVVLLRRRRRRPPFEETPTQVGARSTTLVADSAGLLGLAWFLPYLDVFSGLGLFYVIYPGAPVVKALCIATVVRMWWKAFQTSGPIDLREFTQGAGTILVAIVAWLFVDRIVPTGWGVEQAVFALAIVEVATVYGIIVHTIADRIGPADSGEAGKWSPDNGRNRLAAR